MTISKTAEAVEIFHNTQRRKSWAAIEKHKIVQETYQAGATVSYVARKYGIPPSQLFYWRKVMESGADLPGFLVPKSIREICPSC